MKHSLVYSLMVLVLAPIMMASSCQTDAAMNRIRQVHTGVREAFIRADEFIAPRFEMAGDLCIEQSSSAEESDECMRLWLRLDVVMSMSREALAELENVYNNIETGSSGEADWQYWVLQVLTHGRVLLHVLDELNLNGADLIIGGIRDALDQICQFANCEGGV